MKISYAITVKDELAEITRLISFLEEHKRTQDEIVVLFDDAGSDEVWKYLVYKETAFAIKSDSKYHFTLSRGKFKSDFGEWKNKLTKLCYGDYIFNIDADEIPNEYIIDNLHILLEQNPSVDMFVVPRINTVEGLTDQHIRQWGWRVDEKGWINFPDYQSRIYRRDSNIKWDGKVHETIIGTKTWATLPAEEHWCLYHPKTIEKQEKQNKFYDTI